MAVQRSRNLFHANPVLWLGEIKQRQDPRLPTRLLLLKGMKESQNNAKLRYSAIIAGEKAQSYQDRVIYLPSPVMSLYPTDLNYSVLKLTPTVSLPQSASSAKPESSPDLRGSDKPSLDQLLKVYNCLQTNLPRLFTHTMDYTIYAQDVVLINNILNKTTQGLFKYVQQVALLRLVGHLKFAFVKLELVSMSQDHLEGRITVRWRVVGISGLRVMLKFWKYKLWKWQEIMQQQEVWYDAISHFDVGADGLVHRHIIDRVEEDKERLEARKSDKSPLMAKLALIAALLPRNELGTAIAFESILRGSSTSTVEPPKVKGHAPSPHELI